MICYHGGVPGLKIGQYILPPAKTGARSTAEFGAAEVCDINKVYVTPEAKVAAIFAAMHPSGAGKVYKVETIGDVQHDPDCSEFGLSYTCDAARIVGRVRVKAKTLGRIRKMVMSDHMPHRETKQ